MRKTAITLAVLPLLAAALPAAAGAMKQGLWETTIKSDQMKAMPKLTPEQIEMMRQRGITLPQTNADGAMVTKMCVSKEMAERTTPPTMPSGPRGESDCKPQNVQTSGGSYSADLVCNGPNMQGTGKVKATYSGNVSFTSTYDFKGTSHGAPVNMHSETSGKWVSDDCGSVKPFGVPPAK